MWCGQTLFIAFTVSTAPKPGSGPLVGPDPKHAAPPNYLAYYVKLASLLTIESKMGLIAAMSVPNFVHAPLARFAGVGLGVRA